jgi:large subunit ribosomal protein L21e
MKKSKGFRRKTRHKLRKPVRQRGKIPITKMIQQFDLGARVHIVIEPSVHKGQPHPRFQGKTGVVIEKRGRSYLIEVSDNKSKKRVLSAPVHLRLQEG